MSLVQAWRRQLLGASGLALIVPGSVCAALALLALAGGFGRLGSLGQVLSGPAIPAEPSAASRAAAPHPITTPSHAAIPGSAAASISAPRRAATGVPPTTRGTQPLDHHTGGSGRPPGSPGRGGSAGHGSGPGGQGGAPSSGTPTTPAPTPAPPPAHQPTVVDGVVGAGTSVTRQLPDPVGAIATQTLQSVGSTADQVLPLPAPGGSSGSQAPAAQLP